MRQLFDAATSTYTYLLVDERTREAILIDPVYEQLERDIALIGELGVTLRYVLDTHVHADHVTASGALRARLGANTVVGREAEVACADRHVGDGDTIEIGDTILDVVETPGHTPGCVTYVTRDRAMAFTGDALLVRGCGRTDFQGGSAHALYRSIRDKLFALPDATIVYPGHDYRGFTASTIGEERHCNPRLATTTESQFVELMSKLALPQPARIAIAVPRNQQCGAST